MRLATRTARTGAALVLGLGLAAPSALLAAEPAPPETIRIPLPLDTLDLNGGLASSEARIHLPRTTTIEGARLVIGYANALAVEPDRSALVVGANGEALAELPLVAATGVVEAEIDLPRGLLAAGQNRVDLRVRHHHRAECSRDAFSELWTRIDPEASYLELDLGPRRAPVLADLEDLLASSRFDGERVTVLTTRPADDPVVLEWGGLIAEGVALRRGERALEIDHARLATGPRPQDADGRIEPWRRLEGRNVVIVGTFEELAGVLPAQSPDAAARGLVAIRPLPADPGHVAVIVAGGSDGTVTAAAETFRSRRSGWPEVAVAAVSQLAPADPAPPSDGRTIAGGGTRNLAELGYRTQDVPISFTETLDLELRLPDDYYAGNGQKLELLLNYAYGPGLAPTSALVVRVNGAPWNMVRLDRESGDIVDGAVVELPMGLFEPGLNRIGFQPVLHPRDAGVCAALGDEAIFSLFDDSRLHLPAFARLARQPDLGLFAATGFPYGGEAGGGVELLLTDAGPATVAAAWTLRGKLAQRRGAPFPDVITTRRPSGGERHLLVVGAPETLPEALRRDLPLPFAAITRSAKARPGSGEGDPAAEVTLAGDDATAQARAGWAKRLLVEGERREGLIGTLAGWLVRMARAVPVPAREEPSVVGRLGALGEGGATGTILAFRSPFAPERTATVITATGGTAPEAAVRRLIEPDVWSRLDGDVALWGAEPGEVVSRRLGEDYHIGPLDRSIRHLWLVWRTFMAEHPGYWLLLVFGLILGLTVSTALLLRRRASAGT